MNSFSGTRQWPSFPSRLACFSSPCLDVHLLISARGHWYCRILLCDNSTKQERKKEKAERRVKGKKRWKKKREGKNDYAGSKPRVWRLQFDTVMPEIRGRYIERSVALLSRITVIPEREDPEMRTRAWFSLKFAPPSSLRACRWSRDPCPLSKFQRILLTRSGTKSRGTNCVLP